MPYFTLPIVNGGAILNILVGVSQERIDALAQAGQPIPIPVPVRAMIDTGASTSAIDPTVLARLHLQPTGSVEVNTASSGQTPHATDQYDVSVIIPGAGPNHVPLLVGTMSVTACDLQGVPDFDALIGRDVLGECLLVYNGASGVFTLGF